MTGGVFTHLPWSKCFTSCVTSRIFISGLKLVANALVVASGVGIQYIDESHRVEIFFQNVCAVGVGDSRVKSRAEYRHDAGFFILLFICPLPGVFEMRLVSWLVVGGIYIVDLGLEAGVHDGEVLVGKGDVDHDLRLYFLDQSSDFLREVSVYDVGLDVYTPAFLNVFFILHWAFR
jgi:hypothetical protein